MAKESKAHITRCERFYFANSNLICAFQGQESVDHARSAAQHLWMAGKLQSGLPRDERKQYPYGYTRFQNGSELVIPPEDQRAVISFFRETYPELYEKFLKDTGHKVTEKNASKLAGASNNQLPRDPRSTPHQPELFAGMATSPYTAECYVAPRGVGGRGAKRTR